MKTRTDLGFRPVGNKILVQPIQPVAKVGSVIVPEAFRERNIAEAVVIAIGGRVPDDFVPRVGDRVYTDRFNGTHVKINGGDYRMIAPTEILAIIEHA